MNLAWRYSTPLISEVLAHAIRTPEFKCVPLRAHVAWFFASQNCVPFSVSVCHPSNSDRKALSANYRAVLHQVSFVGWGCAIAFGGWMELAIAHSLYGSPLKSPITHAELDFRLRTRSVNTVLTAWNVYFPCLLAANTVLTVKICLDFLVN